MGNISTAYGIFLSIEVNFEVVVRDVLMYMEMFFEAEYGCDIKHLGTLVNRFEDKSEFLKGECGRIVVDVIKGELDGKETSRLLTFIMNYDVIMIEPPESLPVTEPSSSYEPTENPSLIPTDRDVLLRERARKLRALRNQAKPMKDAEGKWVVETLWTTKWERLSGAVKFSFL